MVSESLKTAAKHLLEGELEACHALAQESEVPDGNYLHAVLHRKEGDLSNSLYWYRRTGNHPVIQIMQKAFPGWTPEKFVAALRANPDDPVLAEQEAAELAAIQKYYC